MSISPSLIWFIVGLLLVMLEFPVPGVILVFFGAGAWLVAITTALGLTGTVTSQLLLFAVSSLAFLFLLRRWVRSRLHGHVSGEQNPEVNLDEFAGQRVLVVQDIEPGGVSGRVEYKGADWSATSAETLTKGERAVIVAIDGITLEVKKVQKEETS